MVKFLLGTPRTTHTCRETRGAQSSPDRRRNHNEHPASGSSWSSARVAQEQDRARTIRWCNCSQFRAQTGNPEDRRATRNALASRQPAAPSTRSTAYNRAGLLARLERRKRAGMSSYMFAVSMLHCNPQPQEHTWHIHHPPSHMTDRTQRSRCRGRRSSANKWASSPWLCSLPASMQGSLVQNSWRRT